MENFFCQNLHNFVRRWRWESLVRQQFQLEFMRKIQSRWLFTQFRLDYKKKKENERKIQLRKKDFSLNFLWLEAKLIQLPKCTHDEGEIGEIYIWGTGSSAVTYFGARWEYFSINDMLRRCDLLNHIHVAWFLIASTCTLSFISGVISRSSDSFLQPTL